MDKAKQAVSNFISGDGHHKTTINEDVNKAVTDQQVHTHRHENLTTAVDKEVHQDHHHTTIQPVKDKEVLPEKHHHNAVPVQHKTFEHGNERDTRATLDREAAKFKNTTTTHDTTHSSTAAPVVTGERVHHHVHEHIQPVIQKDVHQDHIVHTTIPVHETHHAKPVHHGTTTLPATTLEQFNKEKGSLGSSHHHKRDEFDGCPDKIDKRFEASEHAGITGIHGDKHHDHHHGKSTAGTAVAAAGAATATSRTNNTVGDKNSTTTTTQGIMHGTHTTGVQHGNEYTTTSGSGTNRTAALNKTEPRFGSNAGSNTAGTGHSGAVDANGKKISIVDKLNPFKDADGDGHKGIMS